MEIKDFINMKMGNCFENIKKKINIENIMKIWFNFGHLKVLNWTLATTFQKRTTHKSFNVVTIQ